MNIARTDYVYGYHGCCQDVADAVVSGKDVLLSSVNDYDWLGTGIYFWEDAPNRALEWAKNLFKDKAAVVGAKIKLGHCLNLMDVSAYKFLRDTYEALVDSQAELPKNGKYLHKLDCLVINAATNIASNVCHNAYDTVRCPFIEGEPVFPGSKLYDLSHIQIAVRNHEMIEELFMVDL